MSGRMLREICHSRTRISACCDAKVESIRNRGVRQGNHMIIGERLRQLREQRKLTQGDIEERTGLMKCYISRVENSHTVPSLETLERFAAALSLPLYQIFYSGADVPATPNLVAPEDLEAIASEDRSSEDGFILKLGVLMNRIPAQDRNVLLVVARKMASR